MKMLICVLLILLSLSSIAQKDTLKHPIVINYPNLPTEVITTASIDSVLETISVIDSMFSTILEGIPSIEDILDMPIKFSYGPVDIKIDPKKLLDGKGGIQVKKIKNE